MKQRSWLATGQPCEATHLAARRWRRSLDDGLHIAPFQTRKPKIKCALDLNLRRVRAKVASAAGSRGSHPIACVYSRVSRSALTHSLPHCFAGANAAVLAASTPMDTSVMTEPEAAAAARSTFGPRAAAAPATLPPTLPAAAPSRSDTPATGEPLGSVLIWAFRRYPWPRRSFQHEFHSHNQ